MPSLFDPTRRAALRGLLGAATATAWPLASWAQPTPPRWAHDPFSLGVASGSATHGSIVLWTRLMDAGREPLPAATGPVPLRWELADDEAFTRVWRQGQALAEPDLAHAVHVELTDLPADRPFFYRFASGQALSRVGRSRTAPAPDASPARLRLAYASCQRWEHGFYAAWRHLVDDAPDAVLFLGDYIYEYPGAPGAVRMPTGGLVSTLEQYRARYALHKSDADLQAAHAAAPWYCTWDDHEVQNDYAGLTEGTGPSLAWSFAARRAAADQAWYEHMPVPARVLTRALDGLASRGGDAEMRIYDSVRWGRLAQLHLLDCRQYRSPQACTPGGRRGSGTVEPARCDELANPGRHLLGAAQEAWLAERVAQAAREARWNLVGQATLFGPRDLQPGPGQRIWNDGWDGYPAARERVTALLRASGTRNHVLLGGDLHENWVGHVLGDYAKPDSDAIGVEFCGTSITSLANGQARTAERLAENPHFVFADAQRRGYGLLDLGPGGATARLRVLDDATRSDASVHTLARFQVQAGRARVERDG
mgnify:CR=1 FL=1